MNPRATQCVAIVLRRTDWRESSRIVTLLSREYGRRSFLAKGAHRAKSPFLGALDTFHVLDVRVRVRDGRGLQILDGARVLHGNRVFRTDGVRYGLATHLAEAVQVAMPEGRADPELFDVFRGGLALFRMAAAESLPVIATALLLRTCRTLGVLADLERCADTGEPLPDRGRVGFVAGEGGFVRQSSRGRSVDASLPRLATSILETTGRALEQRCDDPKSVRNLLVLVHELLWTQLGEEPRTSLPRAILGS
ncbi:MAG: DNA repair protein RecO [Planctomycetes bacterium]|nr:DNA repair protein RecO [Planctomycetota bacterium]